MLEEKKAELFSSASGHLVRSGALYDILQQWRTFSKAQTAIFFVKYMARSTRAMRWNDWNNSRVTEASEPQCST
jgi:hypothetical protein